MSRCSLVAVALLSIASVARLAHAETQDPADSEESIIGGTAVPAGKWPDAVAVIGATGSCTGTLIAPDVVLTAGHCAPANPTRVIANTTNYNVTGGVSANVLRTTAYPSWETSYDVAVLVLATPITGVAPRKLGTACTFQQGFAAGTQVHLVGFGSTDPQGGGTNTRLNEVVVPVTDPGCTGPGGCVAAISPGGEFIAGGSGKDTCFGDSGGPVYLDTPRGSVVVGAVSRGLEGSATPCGTGGIYVRTDKIAAWIETTTGKQISKDTCVTVPGGGGGGDGGGDGDGDGDGDGNGDGGGRGDGPGDGASPDVVGGCSVGGGTGSGAGGSGGALALGAVLVTLRRRRRERGQRSQD